MKTLTMTLFGAIAIAMMVAFHPAIAAPTTPNIVPQGGQDNGVRAMQMIMDAIGVLVQKMNADIDATNRMAAAQEHANVLKTAEIEMNLFIKCHEVRESNAWLWTGLDCETRTGISMDPRHEEKAEIE